MRLLLILFLSLAAAAQDSSAPWRRGLMGLPDRPGSNMSVQDINSFVGNVQLAVPYFATLTAGDYEANREMIRRMWMYLASAESMSKDPQMRMALRRARRLMNTLPPAFLMMQPGGGGPEPGPSGAPPAAAEPAVAPFDLRAPELQDVSAGDKGVAKELRDRYESDAARAAAAWQNAETVRRSLAAQGNSLNADTMASVLRLPLHFERAAKAMRERDWAEARESLERAEGETTKIFKSVGR